MHTKMPRESHQKSTRSTWSALLSEEGRKAEEEEEGDDVEEDEEEEEAAAEEEEEVEVEEEEVEEDGVEEEDDDDENTERDDDDDGGGETDDDEDDPDSSIAMGGTDSRNARVVRSYKPTRPPQSTATACNSDTTRSFKTGAGAADSSGSMMGYPSTLKDARRE